MTPVWIHRWLWNDAQSLTYYISGTLLFFEIIHQISRPHGLKNDDLNPILSKITGLVAAIKFLRFAPLKHVLSNIQAPETYVSAGLISSHPSLYTNDVHPLWVDIKTYTFYHLLLWCITPRRYCDKHMTVRMMLERVCSWTAISTVEINNLRNPKRKTVKYMCNNHPPAYRFVIW